MSQPTYRLLGALQQQQQQSNDEDEREHDHEQQPILDRQNEQRINTLLQQWGCAVSSTTSIQAAKQLVEDYRNNNENELFVFNPYRPQGGNGFPGKPMWTTLLAETSTFQQQQQHSSSSDQQEQQQLLQKMIAQIFRVDPEYNKSIQEELKRQDEIVDAALRAI
jgi:hypothetical protein